VTLYPSGEPRTQIGPKIRITTLTDSFEHSLRCFDAEGSQYVPVYGIDLRPDNKLLPAVFRVVGKKPGKRPDDLFFFTRKLLFVFFQFPEDQAEKVTGDR
jgi:hypothetical protein